MGKGRPKNKGRRSAASLPRGIPQKGATGSSPFEAARAARNAGRAKHHVHNRVLPVAKRTASNNSNNGRGEQSALAKSIALRKTHLRDQLRREGKANEFVDRRIGEAARNKGYDGPSREEVMLKRIVQERVRRSKKRERFQLDDDDDDGGGMGLTHRGQAIDDSYTGAPLSKYDVALSDDDDDDLDKVDTMLHFGGGKFDKDNLRERGAYGGGGEDMGDVYRSRREELEEKILRKKMEKAERMKRKEDQAETFETMDESFAELAQLLQFRDKEKERVKRAEARKEGTLSSEDKEMDAWDREMKGYLFERKVKATDRTKTPEEVVKEEAERLHALESKRLARMAGDFLSEDEFSDVSDDEAEGGKQKRARKGKKKEGTKKKSYHSNPEELSDSEDESAGKKEEHEVRFTADGLVYVDKEGNVIGKVGEEEDEEDGSESEGDDSDGVEGCGGSSDEEGHRDLDASDEDASAAGSGSSEDDDSGSDEAAGTRAKRQKAKMRAK
ncbi:hypothetical protein ACHAXT_012864 [Thalassiosira profunda]